MRNNETWNDGIAKNMSIVKAWLVHTAHALNWIAIEFISIVLDSCVFCVQNVLKFTKTSENWRIEVEDKKKNEA